MKTLYEFGAVSDGIQDCFPAFNRAFKETDAVFIPSGEYLVGSTLRIPSGFTIKASPDAHIKLAAGAQIGRHDFLLTNSDNVNGNDNIEIIGGIWDGNCQQNDRGDDLFNPEATTGSMFSFRKIDGLILRDMKVKNPLCYYMRFCEAENVIIENIDFCSDDCAINQDGIHFAGFCKNFIIRNLYGRKGSPGDDFLAFNADDCLTRQESFDMINGPIENITVENVHSDLCHCFIRLLSVWSPIKNISIKNVTGSCRNNAINMDAARHCRVPLFKDTDDLAKNGVGFLENILVRDMSVTAVENDKPLIAMETNSRNLVIKNFNVNGELTRPLIYARNICSHNIEIKGVGNIDKDLTYREEFTYNGSGFSCLVLDRNS